MKTETKVLGIILLITAVLLFGGISVLSKNSGSSKTIEGTATLQIDYSKGQKIGSDSAKVKLVEFSDFQCPACRAAEPFIKQVVSSYGDQVQFIYRHFPLPQHKFARQTATLAETAGEQGKFWEMHDKIFETQTEWSDLADATPFFLELAKELNLDEAKVKQELEQDSFKAKIDDDTAEGRSAGVNSTPTFFLNGRKLNLQKFEDLNTAVTEVLTSSPD